MRRAVVLALVMGAFATPAAAQDWAPWNNNHSYRPRGPAYAPPPPPTSRQPKGVRRAPAPWWAPFDDDDEPQARPAIPRGPALLDGGGRPSIAPMAPQQVAFRNAYGSGTIVIDTAGRSLYLVTSQSTALRYPIAVGRIGFTWTGRERISRIATWPDWHPPKEMRERDPRLPEKMTGGIRNPLGAMALYLGNSLYRIHGTNDARSIGQAGSSGCFRMMNGHVVDLAGRVGVGTTVHVLSRLPSNVAGVAEAGPRVADAAPKRR